MAASSRSTFSYSAAWDDVVALLRPNFGVLTAIAGVFIVLPDLLVGVLLPRPENDDFNRAVALMLAYFREHWPALLAAGIVGALGLVAILLLLLDRARPTVGAAIGAAPALLIPFLFAGLFANLIVFGGMLLLLLPGLYAFGRLALSGPLVVAERIGNPVAALRRSWELTRGRGWVILGFVLAVVLVALIATWAAVSVLGSLFLFAADERIGRALVALLDAIANGALEVLLLLVYVAIYRQLT